MRASVFGTNLQATYVHMFAFFDCSTSAANDTGTGEVMSQDQVVVEFAAVLGWHAILQLQGGALAVRSTNQTHCKCNPFLTTLV
jgi:hypothetical protein